MPELPEVETMRRGVAGIIGSRIRDVRRPRSCVKPIRLFPQFPTFRRRATGRRIVGVDRLGKRLLIELDSGDRIVLEPRMTGRVLLAEAPDRKHLRLVFDLEGGRFPHLIFWSLRGLGAARLLTPRQLQAELGPHRLGPDALEVSPADLCMRLRPSRRAIKVALMDQRAVAGIGNLYASEILHRAGVHPETPCHRVSAARWKRVHAAMRDVLEAAIRLGGSTLADGNYRDSRDEAGRFQHDHRVYQRAGGQCVQCGRGKIVRIVQAQRSTFYCPKCQPKARPSRVPRTEE